MQGLTNAGTVLASGTLNADVTNAGIFTVTGPLTGLGTFTQQGGIFDLGNNAISLGSFVLTGGVVQRGTLTATNDYDVQSGTVTAVLAGTAGLDKTSNGTVVLNSLNTYSGPTTISGGTLALFGGASIQNSAVTVGSGATLAGSGTVGSLVAQQGATVAPGAVLPFGVLNVAGTVAFAAGSTYQVQVNAAGRTDQIVANRTATIGGGTVDVVGSTGGVYSPATRYTILTADGGLTGRFANLTTTSNLAFLDPALSYDANDVILGFTRNTVVFPAVGVTPNQRAAGASIESLGSGALYGAVLSQSAAGARQAFDAASARSTPVLRRQGSRTRVSAVMRSSAGSRRSATRSRECPMAWPCSRRP